MNKRLKKVGFLLSISGVLLSSGCGVFSGYYPSLSSARRACHYWTDRQETFFHKKNETDPKVYVMASRTCEFVSSLDGGGQYVLYERESPTAPFKPTKYFKY